MSNPSKLSQPSEEFKQAKISNFGKNALVSGQQMQVEEKVPEELVPGEDPKHLVSSTLY